MPKKSTDSCSPCGIGNEEKKDQPCYPCVSVDGENVDKLKEELGTTENGTTFTALVTLKLTGSQDDKYSKRLSFDMLSIEDIEVGDDEEPEEKPSKKAAVDKAIASKKSSKKY